MKEFLLDLSLSVDERGQGYRGGIRRILVTVLKLWEEIKQFPYVLILIGWFIGRLASATAEPHEGRLADIITSARVRVHSKAVFRSDGRNWQHEESHNQIPILSLQIGKYSTTKRTFRGLGR